MRFAGCALVLGRTLIVADLHLGLEDRHAGSVGLVMRSDAVLAELERLIEHEGAERVVLNGDVLDDFALARVESRIAIGRLVRAFASRHEIVLVKGNHDPMLASLHVRAPLVDSILIEDALVTHGDRALIEVASEDDLRSCSRIVIGHEHPSFTLSDGIRSERFKCFVRIERFATPFGEKEVVVLPCAHPDLLGTEVGLMRSPIIAGEHPNAEVIAVGDPARSFGTIASLTRE